MIARYRGSLLGLAAGDALGTTLEFRPPGTFAPVADIVGGGPFDLPAGAWTDDTSMALCLAESLVERHGFDPVDQLDRYVRWYRLGHLSSTGDCFDIGNTVRAALNRFQRTRIAEIAAGSFKRKAPPEIRGTGYVVHSLEAALWAFHRSTTFRDGALRAVNLGDDADTTGAVYGQLAGAFYGDDGIPDAWRSRVAGRTMIESFATRLLELAEGDAA